MQGTSRDLGRWPTQDHCLPSTMESRHGDVVMLLRWASREGRSQAAMGSGCDRLRGEAAEQHRYHRVGGSAGSSLSALTTPGKRTKEKAELGKATETAASKKNSKKTQKCDREKD